MKAQVSFFDRRLSVISQFVSPSDCLFLRFEIFIVSKITESISSKHVTKHFWVKGILIYTNEGPHLFPRGDNNEKAEMLLFPLPLCPILSLCEWDSSFVKMYDHSILRKGTDDLSRFIVLS